MVSPNTTRTAKRLAFFLAIGTALGALRGQLVTQGNADAKEPVVLRQYRSDVLSVARELTKSGVPVHAPRFFADLPRAEKPGESIHILKKNAVATIYLERWLEQNPGSISPRLQIKIDDLTAKFKSIEPVQRKYDAKVYLAVKKSALRGAKWGAIGGALVGGGVAGYGAIRRRKEHQMQRRLR